MTVRADTDQSVQLDVGDEWVIGVLASDDDGYPATVAVTISVTLPDATTASVTAVADDPGEWVGRYVTTQAGQHLAVASATGDMTGVVPFTAWVQEPTGGNLVDTSQCMIYLGDTSASDAEVLDALTAEAAAQRSRCKIPANYPADLRQALLRRVARNLAARSVPVATFTSFEGGGTSSRVPQIDAEIARLEGPFRKRTVG